MTSLSGTVQTADGWPLPGALLTVSDSTGQQFGRVSADVSGVAVTGPLPPGIYTAVVAAPGFQPVARAVRVSTDGGWLGEVILQPEADAIDTPPVGPWTIDPVHSTVIATARHLGIASVRARFAEVQGRLVIAKDLARSTGIAEIKAASIDTGVGQRDDHLRSEDFLDVERFPLITFAGNGFVRTGANTWVMPGELTLRGKARPTELAVTYGGYSPDPWGGLRAAFHAETLLHRQDFDMPYNAVLRTGIAIAGTTVKIDLDIEVVQGEQLPAV